MATEEGQVRSRIRARYRLSADDAHDVVRDSLVSVCIGHAEHGYASLGPVLERAAQNRAVSGWRRRQFTR